MDLAALKDATIVFVQQNQAWAPFIVGGLAFGESLAVLSLVFPATVLLVAIGAMIGVAGLEFWSIWLGAAIGASLGDWLSYEIGAGFKYKIFRLWPLSRHPDMIERGERFFFRWGVWSVFIGRFFGPFRAVVPVIAGIFGTPRLLFQAANLASAFVWAFVLLAPGTGLARYV